MIKKINIEQSSQILLKVIILSLPSALLFLTLVYFKILPFMTALISYVFILAFNMFSLFPLSYEMQSLKQYIYSLANEPEDSLRRQALNQCARELLLAQSSDWLFIITNGTMVDYAKKRIKDHIGRFTKLYYQIKDDNIDKEFLDEISEIDCIFPEIDYMIYK